MRKVSITEKRVAIARAVMIVARGNRVINFKEDFRACDILIKCFDVTYIQARAFISKIITGEWSVRYVLDMNVSEVRYV